MKKIVNIVIAFLFLLPTVGLHIDFTHCCGDIQGLGISHQVNLSVSQCCDIDNEASCGQGSEFSQPPVYQNIDVQNKVEIPANPAGPIVCRFISRNTYTAGRYELSDRLIFSLKSPPRSLFQVFLC